MKWHIEFVNDTAEQETLDLPAYILANLLHIFELIEENGANLGKHYTKSMSGYKGLFEIRVKVASGIGRSLFCYSTGKKVIIRHSFVKKTDKTPQKEIKIALERMKEVNHGN